MKKNKKVLIFLAKFFVSYFVLFSLYSWYLQNSQKTTPAFKTATITTEVANQTVKILDFFGVTAKAEQHNKELSVKLLIEGNYTARVIEGCNAISLIILFIAFIIAFSGPLKKTLLYILFGSLIIYFINLLRIAFLSVMIYRYPEHQEFLHNLVFPAIIYGTIFLLWVLWVNKFSTLKK